MTTAERVTKDLWIMEIVRKITSYTTTKPLEKILEKLDVDDLKTMYSYL